MAENSTLNRKYIFSLLTVSLCLFFLAVMPARASVTFTGFNTDWEIDEVWVEWETSSEDGNYGFYVQRSLQRDSGYTRIADSFTPSAAEDQEGSSYFYIDTDIDSSTIYWYQIEAVDLTGASQFSGKLSAGPDATATATNTDSAYPGPGSGSPTAVSSATPDSYPGPGGNPPPVPTSPELTLPAPAVPSATSTLPGLLPTLTQASPLLPGTAAPISTLDASGITTTVNLTVTATLIPLPTLTLIFPEPTEVALLVTATPGTAPSSPWSAPRRLVPLALVVMIWVILGAWFYYSQRNIG